jgi:hypothetical protein
MERIHSEICHLSDVKRQGKSIDMSFDDIFTQRFLSTFSLNVCSQRFLSTFSQSQRFLSTFSLNVNALYLIFGMRTMMRELRAVLGESHAALGELRIMLGEFHAALGEIRLVLRGENDTSI